MYLHDKQMVQAAEASPYTICFTNTNNNGLSYEAVIMKKYPR